MEFARRRSKTPPSYSLAGNICLVAIAYFLGAKLGLLLTFVKGNISPIWPASGIALAALFHGGKKLWPGIFLGAFASNITNDLALTASLGVSAGNTLGAVVAYWLLTRVKSFNLSLERISDVLQLALFGAFLSTPIAALIGTFTLFASGNIDADKVSQAIWVWWVGDGLGIMLVTPLLLIWKQRKRATGIRHQIELAALLVAIVIVTQFIFRYHPGRVEFLLFPFFIIACLRFGHSGAVAASGIVSFIAVWNTVHGHGPFASAVALESVIWLQIFLACIAVTSMLLATAVNEESHRQSLAESEERFRFLADNAPVLIWTSDPGGRRTYVNRPWLEFTGRPLNEELGLGWKEGIHVEDRRRCEEIYGTAHRDFLPFTLEYRLRKTDGTYRWIFESGTPQHDVARHPKCYIGSCIDITRRKRAEEDKQKLYTKLERTKNKLEQFSAIVSKDLKQPLEAINSHIQIIKSRLGFETHGELSYSLKHVAEGAEKMKVLIDDLLAYSRAGSESKFAAVNCTQVAEQVLEKLRGESEKVNAHIRLQQLPTVFGDFAQLYQLFTNLLSNAIKYHSDSPLIVDIRAEKKGMEWLFSLRDNGVGFEPFNCEKVFEAFRRLQRDSRDSGTGIGLAICRKIIESHGGKIWAESKPGQGSVFYFTIPRLVFGRNWVEKA